jgi:hypothetical protein
VVRPSLFDPSVWRFIGSCRLLPTIQIGIPHKALDIPVLICTSRERIQRSRIAHHLQHKEKEEAHAGRRQHSNWLGDRHSALRWSRMRMENIVSLRKEALVTFFHRVAKTLDLLDRCQFVSSTLNTLESAKSCRKTSCDVQSAFKDSKAYLRRGSGGVLLYSGLRDSTSRLDIALARLPGLRLGDHEA